MRRQFKVHLDELINYDVKSEPSRRQDRMSERPLVQICRIVEVSRACGLVQLTVED
jgi:hypothetical protein